MAAIGPRIGIKMNAETSKQEHQEWWWLAANGNQYSESVVAAAEDCVTVSPTPEYLFGFKTKSERDAILRMFVNGSAIRVRLWMSGEMQRNVKTGAMKVITFDKPVRQKGPEIRWGFVKQPADLQLAEAMIEESEAAASAS
jgi:hypothetical protein